ncbi:MAG: tRNA pseudouridine synthase A [Bacteroidota bacterium]
MKFFIHLAYKGTRYHGWQRQPQHPSIQEILEAALQKMTGKKINCIGCGRTDAGVHASQFFCHIKIDQPFDFDPVFRLNKMLPNDISVFGFIPADRTAHAQHDAISRTYTYRIHTVKNAFKSELSAFYPKENLNTDKMQKAIALLPNYRDYRSMCKQPDLYKSTICNISKSTIMVSPHENELTFEITADRFLRGMVRILTGNILEIGYGRMSLSDFEACLISGKTAKHFKAAYPQGLYLSRIIYPYLSIEN